MQKSLVGTKEFWLNFIAFALVVLALPEFVSVVPMGWIKYIALGAAIGNVFLRMYSTPVPVTSVLPKRQNYL